MKSLDELFALFTAWADSKPTVRGHVVASAELRLRAGGGGWVVVWLDAADPEAEFRAAVKHLAERLVQVEGKAEGPAGRVLPPEFPDRAFADFATLAELEQVLGGEGQPAFYFDDEASDAGDPLRR